MKTLLLSVSLIAVSFANAQNVNIPDANFKAYLVGNTAINTNLDTEIQISEANVFAGTIDCASLSISDLTGIEEFTALTILYCENNQQTSIDVSQNTVLLEFKCSNNLLTSLDVSNNPTLVALWCGGSNQLTSLDVSQNIALSNLDCGGNQLTTLDVSQNSALGMLACGLNQLTTLDVSQNSALELLICNDNQLTSLELFAHPALSTLHCQNNQLTCLNLKNGNNSNFFVFNTINNPNLTCIEVDDAIWSTANWTVGGGNIDATASFSTNCNNACTDFTGVEELTSGAIELIKVVDLMGRETTPQKNMVLIYVYSDGTTERIFEFE